MWGVIQGHVKVKGQAHHRHDRGITIREGERPGHPLPLGQSVLTWPVPGLTERCGTGEVGTAGAKVTSKCAESWGTAGAAGAEWGGDGGGAGAEAWALSQRLVFSHLIR